MVKREESREGEVVGGAKQGASELGFQKDQAVTGSMKEREPTLNWGSEAESKC
jgi:hypothetical protein